MGVCAIALMFAVITFAVTPLSEGQNQEFSVEWDFARVKVDPDTGERIETDGFAFTDLMGEIVRIKNTGTLPITKVKVKYLTTTEGHKVKNIPQWITNLVPSDCPRERSYDVKIAPGEEREFVEVRPMTEWMTEDLEYQGMHTIKEWDAENVSVIGDIKKGITLHDMIIDFSEAKLHTEAELFVNGQSCGKKTLQFRIVPPS